MLAMGDQIAQTFYMSKVVQPNDFSRTAVAALPFEQPIMAFLSALFLSAAALLALARL